MNMHLMYTSYFLLISAIFIMAYSTIRYRNSSKNTTKNKVCIHSVEDKMLKDLVVFTFINSSLLVL